ncbi:MAG: FAD-dependent oxidoreductase [Myxococcota bacterium]|jgi:thioredoxin reductase (NADPH)|nr:FAD-dependent oxidoreductase [Myxococcota bacterium]
MSHANILTIDADRFEEVVLNASKPVLLDFFSTECPPCEALASKFEALAELYGEHVVFVKMYRQGNRELATQLGVSSSPSLLFYQNGKQVGEMLRGAIRRADIEKQLHALLPAELAKELASKAERKQSRCDVLILGAGPAGLTAGIYLAQARFKTITIDKALPGGYLSITHQVSNYPGFSEPQAGFMLAHAMSEQSARAGVEHRSAVDVTRVDLRNKEVELDGIETIRAKKVIIATGTTPRPIGVKGEKEYAGRGISYCATCDAKYYQDKHVVVIGGGNSAVEESLFIAKFASKITMVHQFDSFQANKVAQEQVFANPKIEILFGHEPREFVQVGKTVGAVEVERLADGHRSRIDCDGVFIFAGLQANLEPFGDALELDQWGYVRASEDMRTNIPDVFVAGDVRSKSFRQMTTAVADGTIAAMAIGRELGA